MFARWLEAMFAVLVVFARRLDATFVMFAKRHLGNLKGSSGLDKVFEENARSDVVLSFVRLFTVGFP